MSRSQDGSTSRNSAGSSSVHLETAPLLAGLSHYSVDDAAISVNTENRQTISYYHSSDESYFFDFIMEKVKSTRIAHFVDKLAVDSEPGLTNAQLMLNNHDLKPVEAERRQWGPWNFVGFWVADSFNIVSLCQF